MRNVKAKWHSWKKCADSFSANREKTLISFFVLIFVDCKLPFKCKTKRHASLSNLSFSSRKYLYLKKNVLAPSLSLFVYLAMCNGDFLTNFFFSSLFYSFIYSFVSSSFYFNLMLLLMLWLFFIIAIIVIRIGIFCLYVLFYILVVCSETKHNEMNVILKMSNQRMRLTLACNATPSSSNIWITLTCI